MDKILIGAEINLDFQKFFDEIPDSVRKNGEPILDVDEYYKNQAVYNVLSRIKSALAMEHQRWIMEEPLYPHARHHFLIEQEIAEQILKTLTIKHINNNEKE